MITDTSHGEKETEASSLPYPQKVVPANIMITDKPEDCDQPSISGEPKDHGQTSISSSVQPTEEDTVGSEVSGSPIV